jgi:hypothetical protein
MNHDDELIPAFLRLTPQERAAGRAMSSTRKSKPETWSRPKPPRGWPIGMPVPKTVTAETLHVAREVDRQARAKRDARLAALKTRRDGR